ncbi:unnamed protein product [Polarella glacialis]|uniref:Uncharacterized protein n=1 Tax=Polarella glacialis TaxID=89957 RepID=A0A813KP67_POLGL|nr:unnamed protein product [Polarella glacialis]
MVDPSGLSCLPDLVSGASDARNVQTTAGPRRLGGERKGDSGNLQDFGGKCGCGGGSQASGSDYAMLELSGLDGLPDLVTGASDARNVQTTAGPRSLGGERNGDSGNLQDFGGKCGCGGGFQAEDQDQDLSMADLSGLGGWPNLDTGAVDAHNVQTIAGPRRHGGDRSCDSGNLPDSCGNSDCGGGFQAGDQDHGISMADLSGLDGFPDLDTGALDLNRTAER